jgi:hypothetical protein
VTDRTPHIMDYGDSQYTIIRDYDHIIASLEVAIENIPPNNIENAAINKYPFILIVLIVTNKNYFKK